MGKRRATRMTGKFQSLDFWAGTELMSRQCTHCGVTKQMAEFHRSGETEDGKIEYRKDCKVCYNAKRKENRGSNKHAEFIGHQRHRGEKDIDYSFTEWREAVIFFGGACAYCGCTMRKGETLTKDHLVATSKGGKTEQINVIPACKCCNSSKNNSEWREWFMKQSFFSQERMNKIFQWRSIISAAGGGSDES